MEVEKSPLDKKEYRALTLDNGIAVLLICDNRTIATATKPTRHRNNSSGVVCSQSESDDEQDVTEDESGESDEDSDEEEDHVTSDGSHVTADGNHVTTEECLEDFGSNTKKTKRVRSACGVCIRTGSISDPPEVPGLAHLLEHMVFMGSKKYHGENTFDAFTTKHGGHDNASTDYERTVFQFCVHPQYFREGLDKFAHFFASPSLLKQSLDREIEAVDNEFQTAIQSDTDRTERLMASLAKPDHPLSNFVWGNTESLRKGPRKKGINLAKCLREYYKRHYSSHYMTVAVMSCYPLDTLEQWVRETFSAVPHNGLPRPSMADKPDVFDETTFCKLYKVIPVKDMHKISLTWILPCMFDKYRSKPIEYLSWLLGHEGEGSVFACLKKRNLATSLCAGNGGTGYEYNSCYSLFACEITLTDKGYKEVLQCLTVVFQYLEMLMKLGPQERIFREIQEINKNDFNFKEEEEPIDFVETVCEMMELYPVEHYLTGDSLLLDYDPASITSVLNFLTPDKANIMWLSRTFTGQCNKKEKWFGTEYSMEDVPDEWKTTWKNLDVHPDLHLPKPNLFIATDFSYREPDAPTTKYPMVIDECPKYRLWYKKNEWTNFDNPRGWVCLLFKTPLYFQSPDNAALMHIFVNLFSLNITEVAYAATAAQLNHSIDILYSGIGLVLDGFNHKMSLLFEELIKHFANFDTTEECFETAKEQLRKSYSNHTLKPKKFCKMNRLKVLEFYGWNAQDKLKVLDSLTLSSLQEFVRQYQSQLFVEALIQGNITQQEARGMMSYLTEHMKYEPLMKEFQIESRTMQLPQNTEVCYHLDNRDAQSPSTVIIDYYQCCKKTIRDLVISELLSLCMTEPCFNDLRTQQQLGYEVYTTNHNTHGIVGISLTLVTQATKYSAEHAGECMDRFIHDFYGALLDWSDEQFKNQVDALIQEKQQPDISLEDEVQRNWAELIYSDCMFDRLEKEVEELQTITQEEVCEWLHRYTHTGDTYRKLSVKVISNHSPIERTDSTSSETSSTKPVEQSSPFNSETNRVFSTSCSKCCLEVVPLLPGESSVDPPTLDGPRPSQIFVREEEVSDGVLDLESFKKTMFVYPCLV